MVISPTIPANTVFDKGQNSESDINALPAADVRANLFFFNAFTCSVPGCCDPLTYKVSSTTSASGGVGLTEVTAGVSLNQYLSPGAVYYPGEVVFSAPSSVLGSTTDYYIYATNDNAQVPASSGFDSRSSAFSLKFTWKVVCGASSTTFTEGPYPSATLSDTQSVKTDNGEPSAPTRFLLPAYSSSAAGCPITAYEIIDSAAAGWQTASASSKFGAVQAVGGNQAAIPADIALNLQYDFYIRVRASGAAHLSGKKTLIVGCPADTPFTDASLSSQILFVG